MNFLMTASAWVAWLGLYALVILCALYFVWFGIASSYLAWVTGGASVWEMIIISAVGLGGTGLLAGCLIWAKVIVTSIPNWL